ncbi:cell division protein ZapA [Cognatiyoonia sp.]|uniref:cell division protein ZapA n=1 Tax=Cognatiyoonia sp. TaxID=2211652 RepID=UPI003F69EEF1
MAQLDIKIGGRTFEVACADGEEHFLQTAAGMLDEEAEHLSSQIGRMPESRMLLMAGLMLADKTAGLDDKVKEANGRIAQLQARIDTLESQPSETREVRVVPPSVTETLSELAACAEAIADEVERKAG